MVKKLLKYLKWRKFKKQVIDSEIPLFQLVVIASELFKDDVLDVSLKQCGQYYISVPYNSLHIMLFEFDRALKEYIQTGAIVSKLTNNETALRRLDSWCFTIEDTEYSHYTLLDCYLHAGKNIEQLKNLELKEHAYSYLSRYLIKIFKTQISITLVLGELKYERKSK